MMRKLMVLGAGAAGYVLGAKAGRERYEQITRQAARFRSNPTVQKKVDEAKHAAQGAAGTAANKVREQRNGSGSTTSPTYPNATAGGPTGASSASPFGRGDEGL